MLQILIPLLTVGLWAWTGVTGGSGGVTLAQVRADALANPDAYGIAGGAGGGHETISISLNYSSAIGPSYSTGSGAPGAGGGQVGSVYQDTDAGDFYLKKSSGWVLLTLPGEPDIVNNGPPGLFNAQGGAAGSFLFDYKNLAYWGPYDDNAGTWGTGQYVAFEFHALAGAPTGGDGVEGDWAWYAPDGTHVRVYGPKDASGWPSTYTDFAVSDSSTATVGLWNDVSKTCVSGDEVYLFPGDGSAKHNCDTTTFSDGGYTLRRKLAVATGETLAADRLIIGGELVTTAYTTSSSTLAVTAAIAGTALPLGNPSGFGAAANGLVPSVGSSVSRSIVFGGGAGGAVTLWLRADNLADITSLTGTLTLYALP